MGAEQCLLTASLLSPLVQELISIQTSYGHGGLACHSQAMHGKFYSQKNTQEWDKSSEQDAPHLSQHPGVLRATQPHGWYLCQLHVGRVSEDGAVGLLVAGVADELRVPDAEVVLAVRPLREDGDGRSARTGSTMSTWAVTARGRGLQRDGDVFWRNVQPLPAATLSSWLSACVPGKPLTFIVFSSLGEILARCTLALFLEGAGEFAAVQLQAEAGC